MTGCAALPGRGRSTRRAIRARSAGRSTISASSAIATSLLLLAAEDQISAGRLAELLAFSRDWKPPAFPLAGRDVVALGIAPGESVGRLLEAVRRWWEDADFAPDRAQCLARLRQMAARPLPA